MEICRYQPQYRQQIIDLILHIQNDEAKIDLSLEEQPDLLDIPLSYEKKGGRFWVAVENGEAIGTLAFMNYGGGNAVLKKFFVRADRRGQRVGLALYETALDCLREQGYRQVVLDTPSVATDSHRFYERAGFVRITGEQLPFPYEYPDRDSYLYLLRL